MENRWKMNPPPQKFSRPRKEPLTSRAVRRLRVFFIPVFRGDNIFDGEKIRHKNTYFPSSFEFVCVCVMGRLKCVTSSVTARISRAGSVHGSTPVAVIKTGQDQKVRRDPRTKTQHFVMRKWNVYANFTTFFSPSPSMAPTQNWLCFVAVRKKGKQRRAFSSPLAFASRRGTRMKKHFNNLDCAFCVSFFFIV